MKKIVFLPLLILYLSACGGGGGSSASPSPAATAPAPVPTPAVSPTVTPTPEADYLAFEYLSGGDASIERTDIDAFSQSPRAITNDFATDGHFKQGNFLFRNAQRGRGPLLNNPTCQGCHIKDGRGNPPPDNETAFTSLLLKLSLGNDDSGATIADPIYGTQLQTFGLSETDNLLEAEYEAATDQTTVTGEAFALVKYEEIVGQFNDGSEYSLRKPTYYLKNPAWGDFAEGILISPRVASPMIGLGLLGAIPEADILQLEDADDDNADGISGRARQVFNNTSNRIELGRYGWKASTASVLQQSATAAQTDIGLSNSFNRNESCTEPQIACNERAAGEIRAGDEVDLPDLQLAFIEFYSRVLAVPERRGYDKDSGTWQADIAAGRQLFINTGCDGCHVRHHLTAEASESVLGSLQQFSDLAITGEPIEVLSNQHIWPHTDLLLHDMGGSCDAISRETATGAACDSGEECLWVQRCEGLADGRPDGEASGSEWRTAPLWGLGLTNIVNPNAGYLHDGRARSISEAILWHGGEAEPAQQRYLAMSAAEREQLHAYLESL
ncbi:MAG: hypothetical protein KTR17_06060 [Cellvibrionaceae bacterium]|nr:hypothetical protein [Cellvibrionaceae bacterium]